MSKYDDVVCLDQVWKPGSKNPVVCVTARDGDKVKRSVVFQEEYAFYHDENGLFKDLWGKPCSKFSITAQGFSWDEKMVFADTHPEMLESDVNLLKRFCSDNEVNFVVDPRVMFLDIEVDTEGGFSNVDSPFQPIILIGVRWKKKYYEFLLNGNCETEKELLSKFALFFKTVSPEVVSGWNILSYDLPYLFRRMMVNGMDPNCLSPIGKAKLVESKTRGMKVVLKGVNVFDLYLGYKKLKRNELYDNKLSTVGKNELGIRKLPMTSVGRMWREDKENFSKYNQRDLYICSELDRKIHITEYFSLLRNVSKCPVMTDLLSSNSVIDSFFLRKAKLEGLVLPSVVRGVHGSTFTGAYVLSPTAGLYHWIAVFDFRAMYPSIIMSCNLSPETKLSEVSKDSIAVNGLHFSKEQGFVPRRLAELMWLRDDYKKKMLDAQVDSDEHRIYDYLQHAVKAVQNSVYGVFGFSKSRIYDQDIAETITWTGQHLIHFTKNKSETLGYSILYSDTDSVFVDLKAKSFDDAMKKGKELEEYLNNSFSELTTEFNLKENLFFIKFEKIYSSLLFTESKKKYAGMLAWKEGHKQKKPVLSIVGFEFKRSDSPLITHEIQQKVLGLILSGKDQKIVCKYLDDVKNTMDSRSVEELGIPKPITKDFSKYHSNAIHKHAAEWSNKNLNTRFCPGSKGIMLFIKKFPKSLPQPEGNVIMFESDQELPEGFEIDSKKIFEKYVDNKVASLFDAVGWLRDANQTRLGEF